MLPMADGSSPHARGTLAFGHGGKNVLRFIPACAGNTHVKILADRLDAVHPRMRGEHR